MRSLVTFEHLCYLVLFVFDGEVQWRLTGIVHRIHIDLKLDEHSRCLRMTVARRQMQRRPVVHLPAVDIGFGLEQLFDLGCVAALSCRNELL